MSIEFTDKQRREIARTLGIDYNKINSLASQYAEFMKGIDKFVTYLNEYVNNPSNQNMLKLSDFAAVVYIKSCDKDNCIAMTGNKDTVDGMLNELGELLNNTEE